MTEERVPWDGAEGWGGCEWCEATYRLQYAGQGLTHMIVTHQRACPVVLERLYAWNPPIADRDPGDEQPE